MECPKGHGELIVTVNTKLTAKRLRQPYYFTQYDICPKHCGFIKLYEEFKVINPDYKKPEKPQVGSISEDTARYFIKTCLCKCPHFSEF